MKILLTADPMIPVPPVGYGGIERIVDALVRHLRREGHTVGLLAHPNSTCPADRRFGWPISAARGAVALLRNMAAVARTSREFQPDVVHSFSRLSYLAPRIACRRPTIMSYQRHTGGRQISLYARLAGSSLRFTGCSEFISRQGQRAGGLWSAIPNFVEVEKYPFTAQVAADAPLVFLSRIESIKGADLAIEIARGSGRRLILAGNRAESGAERQYFDERILPAVGRDGIAWIGEVNDGQKAELLGRAAALVVPIRWDEPFGIVFPEALACGTPVITCRRGAAPEIVTPDRTGFLIESVADGIHAVSRLGSIRRRDCRDAVEAKFNAAIVAAQYAALYREVVGESAGQPTRASSLND